MLRRPKTGGTTGTTRDAHGVLHIKGKAKEAPPAPPMTVAPPDLQDQASGRNPGWDIIPPSQRSATIHRLSQLAAYHQGQPAAAAPSPASPPPPPIVPPGPAEMAASSPGTITIGTEPGGGMPDRQDVALRRLAHLSPDRLPSSPQAIRGDPGTTPAPSALPTVGGIPSAGAHHRLQLRPGLLRQPTLTPEETQAVQMASDPQATPEALTWLSVHSRWQVRRAVAAHPACPQLTLRMLLQDRDPRVTQAAERNPHNPWLE
jgi:hypothetical protein